MTQSPFPTSAVLNPALFEILLKQQLAEQFQASALATGSPQLPSFLDAIPFVNDGDVIRADHFNAIKAALTQLAAALGLSSRTPGVDVLSIFPTQSGGIFPTEGEADAQPWEQTVEGIEAPIANAPDKLAMTFIPVTLPDGVEILSLRAVGELVHTDGTVSLPVRLQRRQLTTDPEVDALDRIVQLPTPASGPFDHKKDAEDHPRIPAIRTVDNKNFNYFLRVTWRDTGSKPKSVTFNSFQITYTST